MDFGKLQDITNVDFTLPPDDPLTIKLLRPSDETFEVKFGAPAWFNRSG